MRASRYFRKQPLLRLEHRWHYKLTRLDGVQKVRDSILALYWGYWRCAVILPRTRKSI